MMLLTTSCYRNCDFIEIDRFTCEGTSLIKVFKEMAEFFHGELNHIVIVRMICLLHVSNYIHKDII